MKKVPIDNNSLAQDKYPWGIRKTGKSNSRFDYM